MHISVSRARSEGGGRKKVKIFFSDEPLLLLLPRMSWEVTIGRGRNGPLFLVLLPILLALWASPSSSWAAATAETQAQAEADTFVIPEGLRNPFK